MCLCVCMFVQDTVDVVRDGMPSKTFSEMMAVLRKFVSFMNLTVGRATENQLIVGRSFMRLYYCYLNTCTASFLLEKAHFLLLFRNDVLIEIITLHTACACTF